MTTAMETLLTIDQLAEQLQIPKRSIYIWRSKNEGPRAIRIGRHLRYRQSDVDEWLTRLREDT